MTTITFIQQPPFVIDFKQYSKGVKSEEEQTVQNIVFKALKLIPVIVASLAQASYLTLKHSGSSFKVIVLGFYGDWSKFSLPRDFYLVVFKVAFWVLGLGWCTLTTTFRLTSEKLFPASSQFLKNYADGGIDVEHIKTNELGIDVSQVHADVQIDNLAQIFNEINFTARLKEGYMAPRSRQEGDTTYTEAELSAALNVFIDHVKNRVAFLGTPPAYDMPRLSAFYQQIENAVRYSIDKSNKDIADFKALNADGTYEGEELKKYNGLLEDRARIAIDLAIAGKHCGARYMGEAMTIYGNMRGESTNENGSLADCITELLARKRSEIANEHIQLHLGFDTHSYNKYMASLGQVLALPGTENIIEHLDTSFDRDKFLKYFFQAYTVDFIIETIQAEIRRSQGLREKILDWIRDYPNDWKKSDYAAAVEQFAAQAQTQLESQLNADSVSPVMQNAIQFQNLVAHLKNSNDLPLLGNDMGEFIEQLFELEAVKRFQETEFAELSSLVREQKLSALQVACTLANLDAEDYQNTNDALDALAVACMRQANNDQSQQNIDHLSNLVEYLKAEQIELPTLKESWNDYINEVFSLDAAIKWRASRFSTLNSIQKLQKIQNLKTLCSTPLPNEEELAALKTQNAQELLTALCERSRRKFIIGRVRSVVPLEEETIVRIMKDPAGLQQAVTDKLEQQRHVEFLSAFKLEKINEGITAALMEWLAVSQNVFVPQEVRG
jgi:hypothetical protein